MPETMHDAVMEQVSENGKLLGFLVLNISKVATPMKMDFKAVFDL